MDLLRLSDRAVRIDRHQVVRGDEVVAELTPLESSLLAYLAARPGRVVDRESLLRDVWGYSANVRSRAVDKTVNRLRTKLERDPAAPRHLVGLRGHGYGLVVDEEPAPAAAPIFGVEVLVARLHAALATPGTVVALVGPAGSGKSCVAAEVARRVPGRRQVDLTGARTREALLDALCDALDVGWSASTDRRTLLVRALRSGPACVVLDGCQEAAAPLGELLPALRGPTSWLLCSRVDLPETGARHEHLYGLDADAGVALLLDGARQAGAAIDEAADRDALRDIVARVGGHAHTLRVIAPRLALQPPARLLRSLEAWMRCEPGAGEAWARVLRGAMEEQWAALDAPTRAALARCAAFDGELSVRAAIDLLGSEEAAWQALDQGRAASVLVPRGEGRLAFVAPMVPVARRALEAEGEADVWRARALEVTVAEAESDARAMAAGEVAPARARLVAARRALSQLVEQVAPRAPDVAARAALAVWPVQLRHDPVRFVELVQPLLAEGAGLPPTLRGGLLLCRAECLRVMGNLRDAERDLDEAERILPPEARRWRAHALLVKCQLGYWRSAAPTAARSALDEALALLVEAPDRRLEVRVWLAISQCHDREADLPAARAYTIRAQEAARAMGDDELLGLALQFHAYCEREANPEEALRRSREAQAVHERAGDRVMVVVASTAAAHALWQLGRLDEAWRVAERTRCRAAEIGDTLRLTMAHDLQAMLAAEQGILALARYHWECTGHAAAESGNAYFASASQLGFGYVDHAEGRLAEARAAYDRAIGESGAGRQREMVRWGLLLRLLLAGETGDRAQVDRDEATLRAFLGGPTPPDRTYYDDGVLLARALVDGRPRRAALAAALARLGACPPELGHEPRVLATLVRKVADRHRSGTGPPRSG